jgi:hypothetical protein
MCTIRKAYGGEKKALTQRVLPEIIENYSETLKGIISKLLETDQEKRLSIDDLLKIKLINNFTAVEPDRNRDILK